MNANSRSILTKRSVSEALRDLHTTALESETSERMILEYCQSGIVSPAIQKEDGSLWFGAEAIRILARVKYLQKSIQDTARSFPISIIHNKEKIPIRSKHMGMSGSLPRNAKSRRSTSQAFPNHVYRELSQQKLPSCR